MIVCHSICRCLILTNFCFLRERYKPLSVMKSQKDQPNKVLILFAVILPLMFQQQNIFFWGASHFPNKTRVTSPYFVSFNVFHPLLCRLSFTPWCWQQLITKHVYINYHPNEKGIAKKRIWQQSRQILFYSLTSKESKLKSHFKHPCIHSEPSHCLRCFVSIVNRITYKNKKKIISFKARKSGCLQK